MKLAESILTTERQ